MKKGTKGYNSLKINWDTVIDEIKKESNNCKGEVVTNRLINPPTEIYCSECKKYDIRVTKAYILSDSVPKESRGVYFNAECECGVEACFSLDINLKPGQPNQKIVFTSPNKIDIRVNPDAEEDAVGDLRWRIEEIENGV